LSIQHGQSPQVEAIAREDGTILLRSPLALPPVQGSLCERLAQWARLTPDAAFLSDADRLITYAEAHTLRRRYSERLLDLGLSVDRPLMIIAENGIEHGLVMLAATAISVPVAIVSTAYCAGTAAPWGKLARVVEQVTPGLIVADDVCVAETALAAIGCETAVKSLRDLAWLEQLRPAGTARVDAAEAAVGLDTIAKLLFTSGSTGSPRAVINTQRMLVSNMEAIAMVWPFLAERPPMLVVWLPWNHTFGGNCCFNIALWFGGHLHIDSGRPTPALFGRSVEAIRRYRPTIYFNVPVGYELLLPILERDHALAASFLGGLDFALNAGAALPAALRSRLEALALAATGRPLNIVGGWGSTETAPFSTVVSFATEHAANLGLPIPGTTIKMVPAGDSYELRVHGPNVTPGYWKDPTATVAMFDEEGFYRIGDLGKFAETDDPSGGIVFDGRVAENFKLASGTFVNVGGVRLAVINAGGKLISDVVVAGEGRSELGVILFPNEAACRDRLGKEALEGSGEASLAAHSALLEQMTRVLRAYNAGVTGTSNRIARFVVAGEPPSAAHDEITEKGYLNQRRVLARRAALVERMYQVATTL